MKKHLLSLATLLFIVLASCSGGGDGDEPTIPLPIPSETPTITIESNIITNGLSFDATNGEKSVTFSTNTDWTLTLAEARGGTSWCTPSATRGSKGNATVKFTVTENTEYDDRTISITIKAGTASKTFKITQKCADALIVTSKKEYEVSDVGETITVDIKSNVEYCVQMPNVDWIMEETTSRAMSSHSLKFIVAPNETYDTRSAEIIFYDNNSDLKETVTIQQAQKDAIVLSTKEYEVEAVGGTLQVSYESNVEVTVTSDCDWIKVTTTSARALTASTIQLEVSENTTTDKRSGKVTLSNGTLSETLTVTQKGKDATNGSIEDFEEETQEW